MAHPAEQARPNDRRCGGVLTEESHCQVPHTCSPQCTHRPAFRHPNKQETKNKTRSHLVLPDPKVSHAGMVLV